ncbi:hypothetical protein ACFC0M_26340 [Streptomyces sp. NPDC056149]|uniref:hypothetical protein n=1 Tax=unclassified Streptomyces TaxID=2593676 RepID=UPI0023810128|nr:hypothetical protein [Streptomyces sp. WZ-12]
MPQGPKAHWNPDTQSWETGPARPARPYTGPMPPRPAVPPPPSHAPGPPTPAYATEQPYATGDEPAVASGRRTRALIAAAVVAVLAAGAGGGYLLWGGGPAARPAAHPKVSASTATTGPAAPGSATPTADASASATGIPSGYHLAHDEKGFSLAVPDGWQREVRSTGVFYTSPDTRSLLQIFQITEPGLGPQQALEQASKGLAGNPGYEEMGIEPRQGPPGPTGSQLTYAYDSNRLGLRVQAVDCAFTAPDGRQFAVLVLGPASDWPRQQEIQRIALDAFDPAS